MFDKKLVLLCFWIAMPITLFAGTSLTEVTSEDENDIQEKAARRRVKIWQALRKEIAVRTSADTAESLARTAADSKEAQVRQAADDTFTAQISGFKHAIGEAYGGGYVFHTYDGGQHGLIVSGIDLSVLSPLGATISDFKWGGFTSDSPPVPFITNAIADGIGAGKANTAFSIAAQIANKNAAIDNPAMMCHFHRVSQSKDGLTYSEWYLPSKYELNLLYQNRNAIPGGFNAASYWSSTEFWNPATPLGVLPSAWSQSFIDGTQTISPKTSTFKVRAIRSF